MWSPDGTTWVSINWVGPESELLAIAEAVTFTESAGEWMTLYDVGLPAIVTGPTGSG